MELQRLIATNLHKAMERKFYGDVNQSALARLAKVSQKTISNILSATSRPDEEVESLPSTSIAIIATLAETLGLPPWALLHPDPERAAKLDDMYRSIERDFSSSSSRDGKRDDMGGVVLGEIAKNATKAKIAK